MIAVAGVELRGVNVRRGRNFTLSVEAIKFDPGLTVISGPNGSGKSTLIECLIGQRRRSVAYLTVDGLSLHRSRDRSRAFARLGYVPQAVVVPRAWRVSEYLAYAGWLKGLDPDTVAERSDNLATTLGLDPTVRIRTLSGGLARRLMVGQALMADPSCLILDECSVGLDATSQELLMRIICDAAQTGTVIATDHTGQLAPKASQLVHISRGRITS